MEMSQSDPGTSAPQPSTSGAPPPNTVQAPTPVSAQGPPQPQQLTPQQQQDNNYRQRLMEQLQRMSPKDKYAKVAPHARCFFVSV